MAALLNKISMYNINRMFKIKFDIRIIKSFLKRTMREHLFYQTAKQNH